MVTEVIRSIEEIHDFNIEKITPHKGSGGASEGLTQMIRSLSEDYSSMDGFIIQTDKHVYHILIDNGQSCCEDWGYFSSDDELSNFIGVNLQEVKLTDKALNTQKLENRGIIEYGLGNGGIQFVNFVTDRGVLQFAVYNAHNGYYGHGIVIAKDEDVLLSDTL